MKAMKTPKSIADAKPGDELRHPGLGSNMKTITPQQAKQLVAEYADERDISLEEAQCKLIATGFRRVRALSAWNRDNPRSKKPKKSKAA